MKGSCDTLAILQVESHGGGGNDNNNYRNNFKSNDDDDDDNAGGKNFGGGSGEFFKTTWLSFSLLFLLSAGTAAAAAAAASVDADNEDDESYLLLEGWLSWLDKLVNECLDDQGNLDLSRLEKMLETSKGSKSKNAEGKRLADLADELWEAVDQGNIKRAESVIESVDKDGSLEFGKHAIRSICGKDQKMIEAAVEKKEFWMLVQHTTFGSVHQQALAQKTLDELLQTDQSGLVRQQVESARDDIKTIDSVLVPYERKDVKGLVKLLKSGTEKQKLMSAQALNGLCGIGLSKKVARSLDRMLKELAQRMKDEVQGEGVEEGRRDNRRPSKTPLADKWQQDFTYNPLISMAGLLGAIATHEPQWLDEYLEPKEDFLSSISVGIHGTPDLQHRNLLANLLLVLLTANEKVWLRCKEKGQALKSVEGVVMSYGKSLPKVVPLLQTCVEFEGTHQEMRKHLTEKMYDIVGENS